jgi:twinkle protein
MSFYGSNDVNKVLGTITYAIERYSVSLVVIDTLQFFLSGQGEGFKKFDMQDYVMAELRSIATAYNVHIAVVIHPRKTEDSEDVGIHSIYGTSKATQEADNIWVIQNRDGFKIFDIKKNRYDGDVGRVAMGFDKNSKSFFELRKKELESLFSK